MLSGTFGAEPKNQAESATGFGAKNFQLILSLLFSPLKVEQQFSGNDCVLQSTKKLTDISLKGRLSVWPRGTMNLVDKVRGIGSQLGMEAQLRGESSDAK